MKARGSWVHVLLAALAVVLVMVCTVSATGRYTAVALSNVVPLVVLAVQLWRGTSADKRGWQVMLLGVVIMLVHNLQNVAAVLSSGSPAAGVPADTTLALGYLLLLAGGLMSTLPWAQRDPGGMLDAAVIGFAAASVMWAVILQPAHLRIGSSGGTMAFELFLVLIVTALTGTVIRAAVSAPAGRVAALSLLVAMGTTDLSDIVFTLTENPTSGLSSWWASALCVVALTSYAGALLHPSARALTSPSPRGEGLTRPRLLFIGAALSVNPAIAGLQALLDRSIDIALLSVGSLVMVPLVVTRIGLLAQSNVEAAQRLLDLASLDELTGLPNRRTMTTHLTALLRRVATGASPGAVVLYLDLDGFKAINDTHGHAAGDGVLRAVAARVRDCVRPSDLVSRFGGDEFVVILEGVPEVVVPAAVGAVEHALADPVIVNSVALPGHASIGVAAVHPGQTMTAEVLLAMADEEMYREKRAQQPRHPGAVGEERTAAPAAGQPSAPPAVVPAGPLLPTPRVGGSGESSGRLVRWR